ncbi:MAG: hypothetical protein ACRDG6_10380 [Candidatus Limnocylindria bacterium]
MRELAAAALLLLALVVGALAPRIWPDEPSGGALASGRTATSGPLATVAGATFAPVSWKGKDGGTGYVICGSADNWSRPTLADQHAHLASDPRYARMRADDPGSPAENSFRAGALLYDGSALNARIDLVALTGMWTDPHVGGNAAGCTSTEPQVWLMGYEPVSFRGSPSVAELVVREAPGYRMVIVTGEVGTDLVIVRPGGKLAVFDTARWAAPKPPPAPKPAATSKAEPSSPSTFPMTDRPLELALPTGCQTLRQNRHVDDFGATWTVQCGSAKANLDVASAAMRQGWTRMQGPPIGVGIQVYAKGMLSMQLAYRLDGPAFADPFQLVQYSRPFAAGGPAPSDPLAYLRVPTGFVLPTGCAWGDAPAGFTDAGAYKLPFTCPAMPSHEIQPAFTRAVESQGWRIEKAGSGMLSYAKDDLRLTVTFGDALGQPSANPWVIEALCCSGP